MHILHILDHSLPLHSGYTFRTVNLLREQRHLGWTTDHLTGPRQTGCTVAEEEIEGLHFYRTPRPEGLGAGNRLLGPWREMRATEQRLLGLVQALEPDLLHAHSPVLNAYPALRVGRKMGIPVVYEVRAFWEDAAVDHGTTREQSLRYRATRALETRALRQVAHIFTICAGLRDEMISRGLPPTKITIIPNAVDTNAFQLAGKADSRLKDQLGLTAGPVLGFVGSFYAYEGLDLLIEALPFLLAVDSGLRVLLVGGGPQEANLKAQAERLGVADKVVFTGRVAHNEVNRYYNLIDLLVYPRRSMRLTELVTPLKPLEAMAQGRLLIASDVGGHRELIRDGENGRLFAAGQVAALVEVARQVLVQPASWSALRQAGRAFVEQERNWPKSVAQYAQPYAEALAVSRSRRSVAGSKAPV